MTKPIDKIKDEKGELRELLEQAFDGYSVDINNYDTAFYVLNNIWPWFESKLRDREEEIRKKVRAEERLKLAEYILTKTNKPHDK